MAFRRIALRILLLIAAAAIVVGIVTEEHRMMFSHAIVVCLSCIGLG